MDTEQLKNLINKRCLVIDPRTKKKEFEPAKVIGVYFAANKESNSNIIYEHVWYKVMLDRKIITKNKYKEKIEYARVFEVSGDKIKSI